MLKYILAAGAVLILGLVAFDYYVQPLEIEEQRLQLIAIGLAFAIGAFVRFRQAEPHETGFMQWLARNRREVLVGVGDWHGRRIGPKTLMIRYVWVMSPGIATFSKATEHYVVGSPEARVAKAYCLVVTALLGWWHFYGLAATPRVLKENWRDSNAQSAGELLDCL